MSPRVTVIPGEIEYPVAIDAPELSDPDEIVTIVFPCYKYSYEKLQRQI
jgi:hypothetical protein